MPENTMPLSEKVLQAKSAGQNYKDIRKSLGVGYYDQLKLLNSVGAEKCVQEILRSSGATEDFSPEALAEAEAVNHAVRLEEHSNRLNLCSEPVFTIDSTGTCDIDDAVSIRRAEDGYVLGVHIADVSHYVPFDSCLEQEAFRRGTSVYFAGKDIPMLPLNLSKVICSLLPGEIRLTFSCIMRLDSEGKLIGYRFDKSVIRSRVNGVYSEINDLLAGSAGSVISAKYASVSGSLDVMAELYEKLAVARTKREALTFEDDSVSFVFDDKGKCRGIKLSQRGLSEHIIEEFMLLANQAAALYAESFNLPFLYRVHDAPSEGAIERLKTALGLVYTDCPVETNGLKPSAMNKLIEQADKTPHAELVRRAVRICMSKAVYSTYNGGHAGLGLGSYTHFTSPIRRYPDLVVHRILSDAVSGMSAGLIEDRYGDCLEGAAVQACERERSAAKLERTVENCYKAEFILSQRGSKSDGIVTGSKPWGMEVQLPNTVAGTVPIRKLPGNDWTCYENIQLRNTNGDKFTVGDKVTVRIENANVFDGRTDLSLLDYRAS